jgi:hypothetical protein
MRTLRVVVLTLGLTACTAALADARCNCSSKVGQCDARVKLEGNRLLISSSVPQCSMVVFHADGQPRVTTVTDGISSEEWLGPSTSPRLEIDSCAVCQDRSFPAAALPPIPAPTPGTAFLGTWKLTSRCTWGSSSDTFSIDSVAGGNIAASGSFGNCSFDSGRVTDDAIAFTCSNWLNRVSYRGRLVSPIRIEGTYTQSTSSETCNWQASKD